MSLNHLVPGAVPWMYAYTIDYNSIEVYWDPIPKEDTHGILLDYVVHLKRFNSKENFTTIHVNASTRVTITKLMKATTYEIKVAGRTSVGEGPSYDRTVNTGLYSTLVTI